MYANRYAYCGNVVNTQRYEAPVCYDYEFSNRVQVDFKRYLFLGVKRNTACLEQVVESASSLHGYEKHKTTVYHAKGGDRISHLYIKFRTSTDVIIARDHFRTQDNFHSELVDDILRSWFIYEMMCGSRTMQTCGIFDVDGEAKYSQPLSLDIAVSVLGKFGNPSIIPMPDNCFRVVFSSMAEGIAACIENGKWFVKHYPLNPKFYYRMLLDKSNHFIDLISKCNQTAQTEDFYRLDYFSPCSIETPQLTYKNATAGKDYLQAGDQQNKKVYRQKNYVRRNDKNFNKPKTNGYYYYNQKYTAQPVSKFNAAIVQTELRGKAEYNPNEENVNLTVVNSG